VRGAFGRPAVVFSSGAGRTFPRMSGMLRTKGGIYVPPSVEQSGVELRQRFTCRVCGEGFHDGEASKFSAHVVKCARQHEAEIRESSPRHRVPGIFGDAGVDVEFREYVRRTGRIQ
jgi:hypothetical protein